MGPISVPVIRCRQCGHPHSGLFFRDMGGGEYEATCPVKRRPIRVRFYDPALKRRRVA